MNQVLEALQQAVTDAAERVGPAVVGLGRGWGRGSGVVVAAGQVLTVAHVLRGDEVAVTFADGRTAEGRVAGSDPDLDVAVIAVDTGDIDRWPGSRGASAGRGAVLALANPGGRGLRTTFGLVSATGRGVPRPAWARVAGSSSTRRRSRAARQAARWSTRRGLLGLNAVRREGGLSSRSPPTPRSSAASRSSRAARRPTGRGSASRSPPRASRPHARRGRAPGA